MSVVLRCVSVLCSVRGAVVRRQGLHTGRRAAMAVTTPGAQEALVKCDVEDRVATITLNDPKRLNALTEAMGDELVQVVEQLQTNTDVRAVVLTGAGNAFSAGGDLNFLQARIDTPSKHANNRTMRNFYARFLCIRKLNVPVIAAVNGAAVGAGLCLATACDLRVAHTCAKMGYTFAKLGLHPGMAATHFASQVMGPQMAAQMLLTGELIDGSVAMQRGLVVDVANTPDGAVRKATALARDIAQSSPVAVQECVKSLRVRQDAGLEDALAREAHAQSISYASQDIVEGIAAVKEKRKPAF
ncbi:hypothetical protein PTSG_10087 [Salpingoeca rosetta]|uniref:Enoyl-CoA hydratase/isomerase n=1 Tax=Salpingoeca rosetta (strain ATCC 50818 / BSB-021) TaxID=946362 RepID=F2UPG1_SALR5|nr:uncharacterized protein PTSG_10087 [Salpingoeca rosetta]EGD79516.1 hypothetical protein PTSG_10087 [Salpingoeca rosetta]|eukprot:XP_004988997.1 hypothetical protein PTSG_10087 [Salpingoeca rosetta]